VRTTLNIDYDVLSAVRERARAERRSTGQILSDLARRALTEDPPRRTGESKTRNGFPQTASHGTDRHQRDDRPDPGRRGDMSRALLDVNVLLALLDTNHVGNEAAHQWLSRHAADGWASCALTENGAVRIISQPSYPDPIPVGAAIGALAQAASDGDHEFWPADVSLLDPGVIGRSHLYGHRQVTDAYLLALAVAHDGCLTSFDRSLPVSAVRGATGAHVALI
jgi:toxin-antitoxin system PIN domain toxin